MKKLFLTMMVMTISLLSSVANAQGIYTKVKKLDKFDDVVYEKDVKTFISRDEYKSLITIETKGQKPIEYVYFPNLTLHDGRRDSLSNLVSDIYGYEDEYWVFSKDTVNKAKDEVVELYKDIPDSIKTTSFYEAAVKIRLLAKLTYNPTITFRTISKYQHLFEYRTDLVWIRFKDGSRIIYSKR